MTVLELCQRLQEKRYENPEVSLWFGKLKRYREGDTSKSLRASVEAKIRDALELDRREVFRTLYPQWGAEIVWGNSWAGKLKQAQDEYGTGMIPTCIDFILQHP